MIYCELLAAIPLSLYRHLCGIKQTDKLIKWDYNKAAAKLHLHHV